MRAFTDTQKNEVLKLTRSPLKSVTLPLTAHEVERLFTLGRAFNDQINGSYFRPLVNRIFFLFVASVILVYVGVVFDWMLLIWVASALIGAGVRYSVDLYKYREVMPVMFCVTFAFLDFAVSDPDVQTDKHRDAARRLLKIANILELEKFHVADKNT